MYVCVISGFRTIKYILNQLSPLAGSCITVALIPAALPKRFINFHLHSVWKNVIL